MLSSLKRQAILEAIKAHPEIGYDEIARQFDCGRNTVILIAKRGGIKRRRGSGSPAFRKSLVNRDQQ
jgi:hypothetical protein